MENKTIIIILVAIIVVLAAILGVMFLQSANAKEPSKIKITSNNTLTKGDDLSIKLTDSNNTAISNETVNVTIANKKGKIVVNETVKTNSKGKAKLDLKLDKGKYVVNVTFAGNDNCTASNATQKLTIKEEVKETVSESSTKDYPLYNQDLGYYRKTGIGQDEMGVVELSSGRTVVIAGDGYYEYNGQDAQGNINRGSFLGHGGQGI